MRVTFPGFDRAGRQGIPDILIWESHPGPLRKKFLDCSVFPLYILHSTGFFFNSTPRGYMLQGHVVMTKSCTVHTGVHV